MFRPRHCFGHLGYPKDTAVHHRLGRAVEIRSFITLNHNRITTTFTHVPPPASPPTLVHPATVPRRHDSCCTPRHYFSGVFSCCCLYVIRVSFRFITPSMFKSFKFYSGHVRVRVSKSREDDIDTDRNMLEIQLGPRSSRKGYRSRSPIGSHGEFTPQAFPAFSLSIVAR